MVVVGNFSVRLVHADTKEPFKEHRGPDGKIYAEIEPGVEYFIETEVVGGDPKRAIIFGDFNVDGKKLQHHKPMYALNSKFYNGIHSNKGGTSKMRALSFQSPARAHADSLKQTGTGELSGTVKVNVSEAIYAGTKKWKDHLPVAMEVAPVNAIPGMTDDQMAKVVRSGEGSHLETTTYSGDTYGSYDAGKLLHSFTINYCSVLGLIEAGVLPKPKDIWETARLYQNLKRSSKTTTSNVEPKRVKTGGLVVAGFTLRAPTEHDFFDLCDVPDAVPGSEDDSDGDSNVEYVGSSSDK